MENAFDSNQSTAGELPKARSLFKSAWQVYRQRFWVLIGIIGIPYLIGIAVVLLGIALSVALAAISKVLLIPILVIAVLLGIVAYLWIGLALYCAIKDSSEGIGIRESFRRAWGKKLLSFLWVGILASLVNLGGAVLLIVPGIIFAIWFSLSSVVFVVEDQRGFNALLRSKEYVGGRWWKVLWRFLFVVLVPVLVGLVALPLGLISKDVQSIASNIVNLLLTPLVIAYTFELYRACRDSRPQIVNQPVSGKKGFFVFSAILGLLAIILVVASVIGFITNPPRL